MNLSVSESDARSITVDGLLTHYFDVGQGQPVVLLHGSGPGVSAYANWGSLIGELARDFRVLAFDMPGFGKTQRMENGYSVPAWCKHLLGFLEALDLRAATLVGNSLGGSIALAAAATDFSRIARLVLMGTPCGRFEVTPALRAGRVYDGSQASMRQVLEMFPHDKSLVTESMVQSRWQAGQEPGALEAFKSLVPDEPGSDGAPVTVSGVPEKIVARLSQPILVLHGREDEVVPSELGLRIHRAAQNSEFHSFSGCGHWVQLERREGFLELTRNFAKAGKP